HTSTFILKRRHSPIFVDAIAMETQPPQEPSTGAFTVALHSLTWQPDAPNASTTKARQLWAFVQILLPPEQPLERVWFSGDNDNMFTKSLSLSTQSSGQTLAFDYNQSSRLVLLTIDSMEELMQAQLVLTLYSGSSRSRTTDFQLGKTQISLRAVLRGEKSQLQKVEILSPGEAFAMDVDIQCDVGLADFLLGARVLQAVLADYETTVQQAAALTTAMVAAGARVEAIVEILHTPLVLCPPQALETPSTPLKDLIPLRDLSAESEEQRDVYVDLRTQLRLVVVSLLREYEDVFHVDSDKKPGSDDYEADAPALRDEKKQTLIYRLNTQGVYHSFKESLKKRIVPVIRERFARSEASMSEEEDNGRTQPGDKTVDEKKKEQFGQIYTLLMQEVNAILHDTFYSDSNALLERTHAISERCPTLKEVTSILEVLRLKTVENEVSGDVEKSEMLHLDRIAYAEQHATRMQTQPNLQEKGDPDISRPSLLLMDAWYDYARFCIAQAKLEKAGAAFQQCLRLDTHAIHALVTLVAVQCELHDFARTELLAKSAVFEVQTLVRPNSKYSALAHALLAFFFSEFEGKDPTGNLTMFELQKAQQVLQNDTTINNRKEATHLKVRDVISGELRVMKRAIEAELSLRGSEGDEHSRAIRAIRPEDANEYKTMATQFQVDTTHVDEKDG
ncbi:hypothetical protein BBJ29_008272, partial [Phytophthora kernoviae]